MALSRRRLLQLLALGAGAPLLGLSVWTGISGGWANVRRRFMTTSAPPLPGLAYLDIDPAAVEAFEADYGRLIGKLPERDRWPADVETRFLLSTDFFRHDADQARRISYVGLYHPAGTPCNNPLARFD
jgi:hypothetical protein